MNKQRLADCLKLYNHYTVCRQNRMYYSNEEYVFLLEELIKEIKTT